MVVPNTNTQDEKTPFWLNVKQPRSKSKHSTNMLSRNPPDLPHADKRANETLSDEDSAFRGVCPVVSDVMAPETEGGARKRETGHSFARPQAAASCPCRSIEMRSIDRSPLPHTRRPPVAELRSSATKAKGSSSSGPPVANDGSSGATRRSCSKQPLLGPGKQLAEGRPHSLFGLALCVRVGRRRRHSGLLATRRRA